jgi:polyisoprenyl-phosphate glycosyltransferase
MTSSPQPLSVVIPAFNEAEGIADLLRRTHQALTDIPGLTFEIIVVDDGSRDGTPERVPPDLATVLRHPKNYGYGRSLQTGIANARHQLIGIIDADSTYDPRDFARMLPLMQIFDMVVGRRKIKQQSMAVLFLRLVLQFLLWFFSGTHSPDANSGLRIFRKDLAIRGRSLFSQKFSFTTSLTFYASLTHQFVEYIPIEYHQRTGVSKVRHLRDSIRTFFLIMSMALVYQPVKCFMSHALLTVVGLSVLISIQTTIGFELAIGLMIAWSVAALIIALSFLGFILGKIYEQNYPPR